MTGPTLPWRKLRTNPGSGWERLSLLTRGVGDEILRALDGDDEIKCGGEAPAVVLCRLLAAWPRERRRVVEAYVELLESGHLSYSPADGVIHAHLVDLGGRPKATRSRPEADPKPARSAPEADPKLTRSQPEASPKPTRSAPEVGANSTGSFDTDPGDKRREEEIRAEQSRANASGGKLLGVKASDREARPATAAASLDEGSRLVGRLMLEHEGLAPGVGSISAGARAQAGALLSGAARVAFADVRDGSTLTALGDELVAKFLEVFRAEPGARLKGYPPGFLVSALRGEALGRATDLVRQAHGAPVSASWKGPQLPMANLADGEGSAFPLLTEAEEAEFDRRLASGFAGPRRALEARR